MFTFFLSILTLADPFDINLGYTSKGKIKIYWKQTRNPVQQIAKSYLVYGKQDYFMNTKKLVDQGKKVTTYSPAQNSTYSFSLTPKDLDSGVLYIYSVGSQKHGWSGIYSFQIPQNSGDYYPKFAVLGGLDNSTASLQIQSQLIASSFISRLDGIIQFGQAESSLYSQIIANTPVIKVPQHLSDPYYKLYYSNTYFINLNTLVYDTTQQQWLIQQLKKAQKFTWRVVLGFHSIQTIENSQNLASLLAQYQVHLYISSGYSYNRNQISNGQNSFWTITEPIPSHSNSIGFGFLTLRYTRIIWNQIDGLSHQITDTADLKRENPTPQQGEDAKTYIIVFIVTVILTISAFAQAYVSRKMEEEKRANLKPASMVS